MQTKIKRKTRRHRFSTFTVAQRRAEKVYTTHQKLEAFNFIAASYQLITTKIKCSTNLSSVGIRCSQFSTCIVVCVMCARRRSTCRDFDWNKNAKCSAIKSIGRFVYSLQLDSTNFVKVENDSDTAHIDRWQMRWSAFSLHVRRVWCSHTLSIVANQVIRQIFTWLSASVLCEIVNSTL